MKVVLFFFTKDKDILGFETYYFVRERSYMYQVQIVDDEPIVIMGLKNLIPWEDLGFSVVCYAQNGQEAYEQFCDNQIDLIITDIEMPIMNGLGYIERLRGSKESTEIVILTAYEEFEYAKIAIQNHVTNYILKPIDEEQIINTLRKVKSNLEEKKYIQQFLMTGNQSASDDNSMMKEAESTSIDDDIKSKNIVVRQAYQFVIEHVDDKISLTKISDTLGISKNYFCSLFKQETGENFLNFVSRMKIQRAKTLLAKDNRRVYEVCDYLGYTDVTYFTKLFKKYVHMSPNEYKKSEWGYHD